MDFDNDGRSDMLSGSYPGEITLFRRGEDGEFAKGEVLNDKDGKPLNVGRAAHALAYDCDADGDLDLLVGDISGNVWLVPNEGTRQEPAYGEKTPVEAAGEPIKAPGGDAGPFLADWDADGKDDLLLGCGSGDVYWYRNTGEPSKPVFEAGVVLVAAASGDTPERQENEEPKPPAGPGTRTKVCAVDVNDDARLDLLVGDFSMERIKLADLTEEQQAAQKEAQAKQRETIAEYIKLAKAPEEETDEARAQRQKKLTEKQKEMTEVASELAKYRTHRHQYHGWLWLFERTDTPAEQ